MDNRVVVCVRDGSCGAGGIHCECCNNVARKIRRRKDRSFSGLVRTRLKILDATDRANDDV